MEDISFKVLYKEDFTRLKNLVEKRRSELERKLSEMNENIKRNLDKNNIQATLQSRVKRLYSIYLKLRNKGVTLDDVHDLMALRIITDDVEQCYLALGIIHRNWIPIEGRFRDWVSFPKPNGYRSIQTTVMTNRGDKFEVQIRTKEMHREAEYGSAAHWAYKENIQTGDGWIIRLKEFLENDEYFNNPYELNELLKSEMKRNYIHVLTPKGEIKTLPEGSTSVDFAYSVHTQVGNQVTGARINGKYAKLKSILHSGDIVEVVTSNNGKPSRDWLSFVKTSKARSKITLWIKKNEKDQIISDGKREWEKLKKRFKSNLEGYDDEQEFKNNLIKIGYKSPDDFFTAIAINSLKCKPPLLKKLYPEAFKKHIEKKETLLQTKMRIDLAPQIKVEGQKNIKTVLAKCCNPIKGEPILAFVTKSAEIKIHAARCPFVSSLKYDEARLKPAEWMGAASMQKVKLLLYGYNYNEMLEALVNTASEHSITIEGINRKDLKNDYIGINLEVEVKDIQQLRQFNTKLRMYSCIDSVKIL